LDSSKIQFLRFGEIRHFLAKSAFYSYKEGWSCERKVQFEDFELEVLELVFHYSFYCLKGAIHLNSGE
jgi:hypothetical protein